MNCVKCEGQNIVSICVCLSLKFMIISMMEDEHMNFLSHWLGKITPLAVRQQNQRWIAKKNWIWSQWAPCMSLRASPKTSDQAPRIPSSKERCWKMGRSKAPLSISTVTLESLIHRTKMLTRADRSAVNAPSGWPSSFPWEWEHHRINRSFP